jgi:putative DNA primase/helicase
MPHDIIEAARGRWPDILQHLAGIPADQLTDRHQSCPLCGGTDRYRFDDLEGSGSWFCNQCGGRDQQGGAGSGMELLLRRTNWDFATAARRIEAHLGLVTFTPPSTEPPTRGAEAVWRYSPTFLVTRFPGKKIRPLWWDGSAWQWKAPPAPRPLLNLDALHARPQAAVLIVEGEKAADAAARLFPKMVATTWPSGCKATGKADWSPLAGRSCYLWPDADAVGREAMAKVAAILHQLRATVHIIDPPVDLADGWDLADATEWTPIEAASHAKAHTRKLEPQAEPEPQPEPEPAATPAQSAVPSPQPTRNPYFTPLGFDLEGYYYQPHSTGQVMRLSRSGHTGTNLVALAPLSYWETLYPSKTGVNWTHAASDLFNQQAGAGVYDPARIRGRGAWRDNGRSILHLGDRLIIDGTEQPVTARVEHSRYLYQRLTAIDGPASAEPLTVEEASMIAHIADRFHWEVPASGMLLAGWVTLAPICGALDWRPHAWLTAAAGSGKSAILNDFTAPLLADLALHVSGNTTEPGIRQALRADALPVVFDEAESNERTDQTRMQAILGLARVASSESRAHMLKGSPEGDTQRFTIRSMFLLSSIGTALKQGADRSRFAQLTLRIPSEMPKAERAEHWQALKADLDRHITDDMGRRLQARTVRMIPTIRESISVLRRIAADAFDNQRLGDQYGTLLAGTWSLLSDAPITDAQAREFIAANNWEPYRQADEIPDERRCIQRILQHQVRVEAERNTTSSLGELLELALHRNTDFHISAQLAQATLGRHGLKAEDGPDPGVIVSNNAQAIASILRDTAWANCWPTVLTRLPGATKSGSIYFRGAGSNSRGVRVPLHALETPESPPEA